MKTFKDLKFEPHSLGGVKASLTFKNNRGISVVKNQYSYGGRDGLWEVAVIDKQGALDYSTPITDDVLGYQTENDVSKVMKQIQKLS